jgi:hypothetical protein
MNAPEQSRLNTLLVPYIFQLNDHMQNSRTIILLDKDGTSPKEDVVKGRRGNVRSFAS